MNVLDTFAAIGNRWLLDRHIRMQVRCHNNQSSLHATRSRESRSECLLGYINCNPTNIRYSKANNWKGLIGRYKGFVTFKDNKYCYRATLLIFKHYIKRGLNTVEKIISAWVPSNENNTEGYIKYIETHANVLRTDAVTMDDRVKLCKIVQAMCGIECGYHPQLMEVTDAWGSM